jgi:hypothetical protein
MKRKEFVKKACDVLNNKDSQNKQMQDLQDLFTSNKNIYAKSNIKKVIKEIESKTGRDLSSISLLNELGEL